MVVHVCWVLRCGAELEATSGVARLLMMSIALFWYLLVDKWSLFMFAGLFGVKPKLEATSGAALLLMMSTCTCSRYAAGWVTGEVGHSDKERAADQERLQCAFARGS